MLKCPLYFPLAGFVGWALLSLFWAREPFGGFIVWNRWCASGVVFFLALQSLGRPGQIYRLFVSIAISGTLVALLGCTQYLYDVDLVKQTASPASTFANKNMGAQMMIITLPAAAALFFRPGPPSPSGSALYRQSLWRLICFTHLRGRPGCPSWQRSFWPSSYSPYLC